MLPRLGRSIRRPDGDGPLVGVVGREQLRHLLDQAGGLGDHLVGGIDRAGVVLQCADRFDEPAVVRSTAGGRDRRVESAAGMRVDGLFGGHPLTVLPSSLSG